MQDFVDWRIPLWVRRLVTMVPTVAVAAWVFDPTKALVISQVVLSFVLPIPLIALVLFARSNQVVKADKFPPCQRAGDRRHRDRIFAQRFAFDPDPLASGLTATTAR